MDGAEPTPAERFARLPRGLVLASFVLLLVPLAHGVHYARLWSAERRGKTIEEQRALFPGRSWFQMPFRRFVTWFEGAYPEDTKLLLTPRDFQDPAGKARWYLFFNYELFPREVYVREPAWASGTLVDYPRWLEYHFETLDVDGDRPGSIEDRLRREELEAETRARAAELGVTLELEFAVRSIFRRQDVRLWRLDEAGQRSEAVVFPWQDAGDEDGDEEEGS